ncbi:MAG: redoxin domain-containing protein [Armatimonadetes bacterium]|nr:redoxin domain-containing protein [Armatimonadota bacterium]
MRLWMITIPGSVVVLFSAALVYNMAGGAPKPYPSPVLSSRHLVTPAMEQTALAMMKNPKLQFEGLDQKGQKFDLSEALKHGPTFVYFIMDGCPCSTDVEPMFHRLYEQLGHKVNFVGIINKGVDRAKHWATEQNTPYPVLADPDQKIIETYGATNSAFSALVSQKGEIVKVWPGYSRDIFTEMNAKLSAAIDAPVKPFDLGALPTVKTAGCAFEKPGKPASQK